MINFDAVWLKGLSTVKLPIIGSSTTEPYLVSSIDGLGPPELDVLLAETHAPGGIFVDRRAQGREIIARIGLNPDYSIGQSVGDLRYELYGLLSPGVDPLNQSMQILLVRDNEPQVVTTGYVKRIEIVPFNKKPEVQLTIPCLSPYWDQMELTDFTSSIPWTSPWNLTNLGRAPTGIQFEMQINNAVNEISVEIQNSGTFMNFQTAFAVGDRLIVDTNEATRSVVLKRAGVPIRYLEVLSPDSKWLTLHGGTHTFITSNPADFSWVSFKYMTRYWGI